MCQAQVKEAGAGTAPASEHHTAGAFWHVSDSANPKIDTLECSAYKLSESTLIESQEPTEKHCSQAGTSLLRVLFAWTSAGWAQ